MNKRKVNRPRRKRNGARGSRTAPPPFNATISVMRKKFRFQNNGVAGPYTITDSELLDLFCVASSTTAAYRLASAVRLRSIQIWAPAASGGAVTTSVEFPQTGQVFSGPTTVRSDTSMGATNNAHVSAVPPKDSLQSKWISTGNGVNYLILVLPENSIVDIAMDLVLQNGEAPHAVTAAVTGATVGSIYVRALDSAGSADLIPVSYVTV